ncbi:hypothetical protein N9K49_02005 [Flavobacteriaceae bacterium]|nr:hypothetical protein [Flavobacteriaceae bacterium]
MGKGLLILSIVFIVIAMIHFLSNRMMNLEDSKKSKYRKVFWYFYGVFFFLSGLINLLEKREWNLIFIFQLILGIVIIILNALGKIETKEVVKQKTFKK